MSLDFSNDSSSVTLRIDSTGEAISLWQDYEYDSDFFVPSDGWKFTLGDEDLSGTWVPKLPPQTRVTLEIDGRAQCAGIVDGWRIVGGRGADGTTMQVFGRDVLGPVVAACVDPYWSWTTGQTLLDVVTRVGARFGFTTYSTTDIAARSIVTGNLPQRTSRVLVSLPPITLADGSTEEVDAAEPTYAEVDPSKPKSLKDFTLQQLKPHSGEGAFDFLARLCKRFGVWLWADPLGSTLIIGGPDFDQEPTYSVRRGDYHPGATFGCDASRQPTVIIAEGISGGGNFPKGQSKIAMVNELTGLDANGAILPIVQAILNDHKGCKLLPLRPRVAEWGRYFGTTKNAVPMFLKDNESRSVDQLEGFVRKEMGVRQAKGLTFHFSIDGHTWRDKTWAVNTLVEVDDLALGVSGLWWIRSRKFTKGRAGTMTSIECVPRYLAEIGA